MPLPLDFTVLAPTSFLFGSAPPEIYEIFETENVTINLHHDGVTPESYKSTSCLYFVANKPDNTNMHTVFNVLSTNFDRTGKEFLSTIEGRTLPFYGVQWHPERNQVKNINKDTMLKIVQFNWDTTEDTEHTTHASACMSYVSQRFMVSVRQNKHSFPTTQEEDDALIYNWTPTYDGSSSVTYYFPAV